MAARAMLQIVNSISLIKLVSTCLLVLTTCSAGPIGHLKTSSSAAVVANAVLSADDFQSLVSTEIKSNLQVVTVAEFCTDAGCDEVYHTTTYYWTNEPLPPYDTVICYPMNQPARPLHFWIRLKECINSNLVFLVTDQQQCGRFDRFQGLLNVVHAGRQLPVEVTLIHPDVDVKILPTGSKDYSIAETGVTVYTNEVVPRVETLDTVNITGALEEALSSSRLEHLPSERHEKDTILDESSDSIVVRQFPGAPPTPNQPRPCTTFKQTARQDFLGSSLPVSATINCRNTHSDCDIGLEVSRSASVSVSWSLGPGVSIGGINIGLTFGQEYTETRTISFSYGWKIPQGQKGFLVASPHLSRFDGYFLGCPYADSRTPASAVVPRKEDKLEYSVVLTD